MNTGLHASNPDVLNVEVEFRGEDAELIMQAREAMGPAGVTYADAIQRLAILGARVANSAAPHVLALIATCAMAPWLLAWALGGA